MEILNYDELPPTGNAVATFSLRIPALGMTFHKLRLIRMKKGGLMFFFPSYSETKDDGSKTWHPYTEVDGGRKDELHKKVMALLNPFLRGNDFVP